MTDYFALLDQPRRPWLDPEKLKQVFHRKTLRAHPDAQSPESRADAAFAQLNEAYQVLREPKRRLQHLLALEGSDGNSNSGAIPTEIEVLFPEVAALVRETETVIERVALSGNALSRSLVRPELLKTAARIQQMLTKLEQLHAAALDQLQQVSASWQSSESDHRPELRRLYLQFSYLTKWMKELGEKHLQLSGAA